MIENNQTRAYQQIKEMILEDRLKPGQKISKNALVKATGIGDTPVREAILRLQKEGLLSVIPQSGTYVSKIDLQAVYEARFVRENIEKLIMVEAAQQITNDQLAQLDTMLKIQQVYFEAQDTAQYFKLDEEFHRFFYQISNKMFVWQWLQSLNTALNRYRYLRLEVAALGWENILTEHQQLVALLKKKDLPALEKAIAQHIHRVDEDASEVLKAFPDYFVDHHKG